MVDHIELYVSNLETTRAFYSWFLEMLGYELYQTWPLGFSYIKDGQYLVFVQTEKRFLEAGYHRKRIGLNHLAFSVPDKATFDACLQALQEHNVTMLYNNSYIDDECPAIYFEDPERMKLEIVLRP